MARPTISRTRRLVSFSRRLYGLSILSFFLITSMVMLSAVGQNQDARTLARRVEVPPNPRCSEFTQSWGEWCIYTFTDSDPDILFPALSSARGVTTWYRDGSWRAVVLGKRETGARVERMYGLQTSDPYGLSNWQLVSGSAVEGSLIDEEPLDSGSIPDPFSRVLGASDTTDNKLGIPSIVPFEMLTLSPGAQSCCDTLLYTSAESGLIAVSLEPSATPQAQVVENVSSRNVVLSPEEYRSEGIEHIKEIRSARFVQGISEDAYSVVYEEVDDAENVIISLARSTWPTAEFEMQKRDLLPGIPARDPFLIRSDRGVYYLFFVRDGQIWSARSAKITGPYRNQHVAVRVPESMGSAELSAPTVTCNPVIDQWQIHFSMQRSGADSSHVFSGLLAQSCDQEPVLVR